jgi:plastocyanin
VEGTPVAASTGGGKVIEVEAGDLYFDPAEFEASPGDTIRLTNAGVLEHDMASEALGVTMVSLLSGGDTGEYVIPDDASGEVDIYCTVSGHKEAGMAGMITIV